MGVGLMGGHEAGACGRERIALSFSGGKDSSLALLALRRDPRYEVCRLITTVTEGYDRISMHGVRRSLLRRQAASIGLPLTEVGIPPGASNEIYERAMGAPFVRLRRSGIRRVAFGDLFLRDVRDYRRRQLAAHGLECLFPLWGRPTGELARTFVDDGFRARIVCLDPAALDASFAGRTFDRRFLADLPAHVDPCGENGEFHTFVFDGPIFRHPLDVSVGEVVRREGFLFADLLPRQSEAGAAAGPPKAWTAGVHAGIPKAWTAGVHAGKPTAGLWLRLPARTPAAHVWRAGRRRGSSFGAGVAGLRRETLHGTADASPGPQAANLAGR